MSKTLWLACTLELLCVWPVFLGVLERSTKQSFFRSAFALYCQVLLNERDESEKLVHSPHESCFSEGSYSLMQYTKMGFKGKDTVPLRLRFGTCHPHIFWGCARGLLFLV